MHITEIGISILEDKFLNCLREMKGNVGLDPDVTLKDAFEEALRQELDEHTKRREFIKYGDAIKDATYTHKPVSSSLTNFLLNLENFRDMQQLVELKPGDSMDIDELTVRAHDCIYKGTGGEQS